MSSDSVIVSTSVVPVTEQSTRDPSTVINAPSETTSRAGTNNIKTGAVGVTVEETPAAAVPNTAPEPATEIIESKSTPVSLWDEAYDSLKQEQPELLSKYEDLLSRVLIKGKLDCNEPISFALLTTQFSEREFLIGPKPRQRYQRCWEPDSPA